MFYVYILHSAVNDRYYIGQTNNLENRLERHNKGSVRSTKAYRPWELVYRETFDDRRLAMSRETQIKSWKSKIKIQELIDASRSESGCLRA
ncbi:GIY-YIG nuclease family protein [Crocinitomicaceae bacterium]|nr:GIY-YIG nuclease family protein [Crocinitomicaceae bacterium]